MEIPRPKNVVHFATPRFCIHFFLCQLVCVGNLSQSSFQEINIKYPKSRVSQLLLTTTLLLPVVLFESLQHTKTPVPVTNQGHTKVSQVCRDQ